MTGSLPRVWVGGDLVDPTGPSISALDHAVTVGDGVFETAKIDRGQPFALSRHHARLQRSAAGLGLPPVDLAFVAKGIDAVLEGEPIDFGRLRYSVTGGVGPLGSDRGEADLTYVVLAGPQARPPASGALTVVPWTRNERSPVAGLKTTSYAENVVALARAKQVGAIEAVFGNTRGELCECTGSNVFVVLDGEVLTPPADSGLLAGITRELVLEWAVDAGVTIRETPLPLGILDTADEVFITSSTKDVLPIHAVDDRQLPVGPVTTRLRDVFRTRAGQDLDP
ncbi:aminotransferase class IV [Intrasporangium calvum]|uniref:aminodeoxychorismate lyase n=1 Tax=Intrasporangium calvum (strain ATCC 23552 / DSM 43043 / JCM 3097 / NBRC 12989 / NCIMB 10167 / NRRL B-3866 / 7 KIP) TaxID=710696 RepID=E6SBB8_INTC7|nr:aminodeoxychorismate lyase [Intrasporangium calvum]ADU48406.1 aminotransferase class IV [Intrasporangium calvum DSM 43043]